MNDSFPSDLPADEMSDYVRLYLDETNVVVFDADKGLIGTDTSTPMRIVGIFEGIKEHPTDKGGKTLCPVLYDCYVFKTEKKE